jgi:hypothetical protein
VAVWFCLQWCTLAGHFYGNGCKYVINEFEIVPDGGILAGLKANIWRYFLTMDGQVSGNRERRSK